MKFFLVVASPRTGSTLLTKCLKPFCAGEIWTHPKNANRTFEETRRNPDQFFRSFTTHILPPNMNWYGAKLHTVQLEEMLPFEDGYSKLFSGIESAVFLRRKNLTEQAISDTVMRRFKKPIGKGLEIGPLVFDVSNLKTKAENWVSWYQRWSVYAQSKCKVMPLWYEELDADVVGVVNKVRQFLGLPRKNTLNHGMKKQRSPDTYKKIITNYNQIVEEMGKVYGVPFGKPGNRWKY